MSRPVTGLSPQTAVSHPRPPLGMTGAALAARVVGYGGYVSLAAIALPVVATAHPLRVRSILVPLVPLGVAALAAWLVGRLVGGVAALAPLGAAAVAAAAWLLPQARRGGTTWAVAALVGAGVGLVVRAGPARRRSGPAALAAAAGLAIVVTARLAGGRDGAIGAAVVLAVVGALTAIGPARHGTAPVPVRAWTAGAAVVAQAVGLTLWIGANSARVTWFGSLVSRGPGHTGEVALTFDDGPDLVSTLAVRDMLDAHHVKATFFTVGKAMVARPEISRALLADGQLLGDHSYLHDSVRWVDPRYPELERNERAFATHLGVCPAFFRPPHGEHTPFMAAVVARHHMRMVTWDVSAGDWATADARLVARRVLRDARAGSIIDLHDGLNGSLVADRSVVVRALPAILDGLAARRLRPVRLDALLGVPGYRPCRASGAAHAPRTRQAAAGMAAMSMAASTRRVRDRYTGTGTTTSFETR